MSFAAVCWGLALAAVHAPQRDGPVRTTSELLAALRAAPAGARIELAPGRYEGFSLSDLNGRDGQPIVVSSVDRASPAVFVGGVHLSKVSYVELVDLMLAGAPSNGLNIDDGGALDAPSHHVVLRGLGVRDCGGEGNDDGIKLSGVSGFRIEGCTVERSGRGGSAIDMVGCRDGEIVGCAFRDDEARPASSGVQMKGGSRDIALRACRFEHAGQRAVNLGGSTGLAYFRPAPQGFEARDLVVEGCTFVGSEAPIAFVGVDGARVRFNTFYRPRKWLSRILQETRGEDFAPCRRGEFTSNLVVYRANEMRVAINVGPDTAPETFSIARNYWFCEDEPARARPVLPTEEREPTGGADPQFRDVARGDFELAVESPAAGFGASAWPGRRR